MQIKRANTDASIIEQVSLPLWRTLFDAVGWPDSLISKRTGQLTYDDVHQALDGDLNEDTLLALETLQNLGTREGRESIATVMSDRHMPLDALPHDLGAPEYALHLFLKQREGGAFADVFAKAQIQVQEGELRAYNDFAAREPRRASDVPAKRQDLERELLDYCKVQDLGEHVQVRASRDDDGTVRFQIMRSHSTKTPLAVIHGLPGRAPIKYRPVHSDLLRYEEGLGRLRITVRAASMVEVYRRLAGRVLFGDDNFFDGAPVCSLQVLLEDGRAALNRHQVYGVGKVWMTDCIWERGDGQRLTIHASDCFDAITGLNLNLAEGELLQAKLKMHVTGRSARPLIVEIRTPSRIKVSQPQHEILANEVLEAIGIRNARFAANDKNLWSLFPWRQPSAAWRGVFGKATDALVAAGALKTIQLDAIAAPGHPGAGRVLQAEPVSRGDFLGVSAMAEIPSRTLSATDLDGFELDTEAFQAYLRGALGLSGNVTKPSIDGLLDLGVLDLGGYDVRLTYALRQPPSNAAAVVKERTPAGTLSTVLMPTGSDELAGLPCLILDQPVPAKNTLIRALATKLNLTDKLPVVVTAPESAILIVDRPKGVVWFQGIEVVELKKDTHQFQFVELLATNQYSVVSHEEIAKQINEYRDDPGQVARTAKRKACKAIRDAVQNAGGTCDDPFKAESGGYRLTVRAHVV
ncbi:MAG: hypothetical protein AB7L71_05115 [Vicinamibacterales bacterium]